MVFIPIRHSGDRKDFVNVIFNDYFFLFLLVPLRGRRPNVPSRRDSIGIANICFEKFNFAINETEFQTMCVPKKRLGRRRITIPYKAYSYLV